MYYSILYAQNDRKLALIIGNGSYEVPLKNPVNDAKDVSSKLKSLGFDVKVLTNASRRNMRSYISDLTDKASEYDAVLLYYSGHGLQVNGENYLVPVDAMLEHESDAEFECESLNHILANLSEADCNMKIVILDACRNNPFERKWYRSTVSKGLSAVSDYKGTIIHYATAPGRVASDGVGRNSPYTTAFLEVLDRPNLSCFDFFNEVAIIVQDSTDGNQEPTLSAGAFRGSFYFNRQEQPVDIVERTDATATQVVADKRPITETKQQKPASEKPVKVKHANIEDTGTKTGGIPEYKKGYMGMAGVYGGSQSMVSTVQGYRFSPHFYAGLETGIGGYGLFFGNHGFLGIPLSLHIASEFTKKKVSMFVDASIGIFTPIEGWDPYRQGVITLGVRVKMIKNPNLAMWYGIYTGIREDNTPESAHDTITPQLGAKVAFSFSR